MRCSIIMYHYVRPAATDFTRNLKSLDVRDFRSQLDRMEATFHFVTPSDVMDAVLKGSSLPSNSVLLSFDDGYIDHYQFVLPELVSRNLKAVFFPPTGAVFEGRVLDVNKIHFVLAAENIDRLVDKLQAFLCAVHGEKSTLILENLHTRFYTPGVYDDPKTNFFKRTLQHGIPEDLRASFIDDLFRENVTVDESAFAQQLYVSPKMLIEMQDSGMTIGSHGHSHYWLNKISDSEKHNDIQKSLDYLSPLGLISDQFWFCYPYGGYDVNTISTLERLGCGVAVTTDVGVAICNSADRLRLPRIDCNEI